jgi:hypothetical protein
MSIDWSKIDWYTREQPGRVESAPSVTIGKTGRISFGETTAALFSSPPELMQLGLLVGGRGKKTLIMRSIAPDVRSGPTPLKVGKQGKRFVLNATRFFEEKGLLDLLNTTHAGLEYDKTHDSLVVSLKAPEA